MNNKYQLIEHQHDAGDGQYQEQEECDAPHSPGIGVADSVSIDTGRVEMQEHIR